eukprot:6933049-Ditylum_brightwellii.AAC.2
MVTMYSLALWQGHWQSCLDGRLRVPMMHSLSHCCKHLEWINLSWKKPKMIFSKSSKLGGGIGHIVGLYELISGEMIQQSIENGQIWTICQTTNSNGEDTSEFALITLYQDERIDSLKSNW